MDGFMVQEPSKSWTSQGQLLPVASPDGPIRGNHHDAITIQGRQRRSSGSATDLLRLYLQDIGRVDLLTNEEEVTLARLVQRREALLLQQRELAESDAAIGELHRLEELQRREA